MAITRMTDVAYLLTAGSDAIFDKAVSAPSTQYWKDCAFVTNADKWAMNFDTMGNLGAAQTHVENNAVDYKKISWYHRTTLTCAVRENGFSTSMEADENDLYDFVKKNMGKPLVDTMIDLKESLVAAQYDSMFATTGADGVYYASDSHPLKNSALLNDNLMTASALNDDTLTSGKNQFNHIYNQAGRLFPTSPTHLLIHPDKQATALAILGSALIAFQLSNTKNVQQQWMPLKIIMNPHLDISSTYPWFLLDKTLEAGVTVANRFGMSLHTEVDYDNYTFKGVARETYAVGQIAPGYGVVGNAGVA